MCGRKFQANHALLCAAGVRKIAYTFNVLYITADLSYPFKNVLVYSCVPGAGMSLTFDFNLGPADSEPVKKPR
jgi:hypothetical protein